MKITELRTLVLAILALVSLFYPLSEEVRGAIADHATTIIGSGAGLWAIIAARRALMQRRGEED